MSKIAIPFTKEATVNKSDLLYGIAMPVLLISELALLQDLSEQYNSITELHAGGLEESENQKLLFMGESFLAIIGPPVLIWKTLQLAAENHMGERLSERAPNF